MTCVNCRSCPAFQESLFKEMSDEGLDRLQKLKTTIKIPKKNTLFSPEDKAQNLYCVMSGNFKIIQGSGEKETIVRVANKGGLLGHRSLFSQDYFKASAKALSDAKVCKIPNKNFIELVFNEPQVAVKMVKNLTAVIEETEKRIHQFHQYNIRQRFSQLLLMMSDPPNKKNIEGPLKIEIKLSREELASMVPAAMENIVRLVSEFKRNEVINEFNGKIEVLKPEALRQELL